MDSILPIIDLDAPLCPSKLKLLEEAFAQYGAFYVTSESIRKEYEQVISSSYKLFENPRLKAKPVIPGEGCVRGYIPLGGESGGVGVELKEGFSYGKEWEQGKTEFESKLEGHNRWPEGCESEKATLCQWYDLNCRICLELVRSLEKILGCEGWVDLCEGGDKISLMRLFHYFPLPENEQAAKGVSAPPVGSSPHTDWGFLTLVLQQPGVKGLQLWVKGPDEGSGEYRDVPPIDGTLVVNIGDYLSLLTGSRLLSPLHRVLLPNSSEERGRLSAVFFFYPDFHSKLPPCDAGASRTSVSKDQSHSAAEGSTARMDLTRAFGEIIWEKWVQVGRAGVKG